MSDLVSALQTWRHQGDSYLYFYNNGIHAFSKHAAPKMGIKVSIGFILNHLATKSAFYSDSEKSDLMLSLNKIKASLEHHRSQSVLKRIRICFLSALYNYYLGCGFRDSLELIQDLLHKVKTSSIVQVSVPPMPGVKTEKPSQEITFSLKQLSLLSQVFLKIRHQSVLSKESCVQTAGYSIKMRNHGTMNPVLELPSLCPGYVFKELDRPEGVKDRCVQAETARNICSLYQLDKLIVPECKQMTVHVDEKQIQSLEVFVQRKYEIQQELSTQTRLYQDKEKDIEDIVRQLTILVCRMPFTDVRWDNIPLIDTEHGLQAVLIDLEIDEVHTAKHALLGWGNPGEYGVYTPGLIQCFPYYGELIYHTAEKHLESATWKKIHKELEEALKQANCIKERQDEICQYHQKRGIVKDTPAIALDILEDPEFIQRVKNYWETYQDKENYKEWACYLGDVKQIVLDINAIVDRQVSEMPHHLVYAREWRFTGQETLQDSTQVIDQYRSTLIPDVMLPYLKEKGSIHSILKGASFFDQKNNQIRKWGIHLRRVINHQDTIVQF
jgi:hypothetical protein